MLGQLLALPVGKVRRGEAFERRRRLAIPPRSAAGLFGNLAGALERVELDGQPGWTLAGGTATPPAAR